MQSGHLLTRSGLTYPEVSSKVYHDSFCQSDSSVSLPWVICFEAFYLHVVSSLSCIPAICPKSVLFSTPFAVCAFVLQSVPSVSCCSSHVFHLCCCYSSGVTCFNSPSFVESLYRLRYPAHHIHIRIYIYIYIKHILLNRLLFCLLICGGWMTSASEIKGRSLTAWSAIRKCYSESNRKGTSYVQRNEGRLTGSVTTCVGIAFCRVLLKGNLESTGRRRRRKQLLDDLTEKLWKRLWSCRKTDLWLLLLLLLLRWCDDYMIMIIIIIIRYGCLLSHLFSPVLLSDQQWSPPLTLQASHCSTFRIVCDVPSVAVFCSESIECFPGTVSISFLKLLVTIPVAPVITGTTVHFRFHIRCISIHKLLYFNFFSASFCTTFLSAGIATSISACFIIIIIIIIITVMMMMMSCSYNEIRT